MGREMLAVRNNSTPHASAKVDKMRGMTVLRVLSGLAVLAVLSWGAPGIHAGESPAAPVGAPAPTFTLEDSDGEAFALPDALTQGTVVLAFFPRAFSRASIRQWEGLRGVSASFAKAGVTLVGVSTESKSKLKNFRAAHKLPFRLLSDGTADVSRAYGALLGFERRELTAQKMVVVDRRGVVTYRDERYETKTEADLRALLRAVGGD